MFNTTPYPTREFPENEKNPLYRLTWISRFHFNPLAMTEPAVDLIFTPYLEDKVNPSNINHRSSYDFSAVQMSRVGAAQLAGLYIGAFARDRTVVALPDYGPETYDLLMDDEHMEIIRADATYREGGVDVPYIPPSYYPLPEDALSTRCLVVECDVPSEKEVSRVIFPCPVLLTAYFGTSSNLLKEILKGGLSGGANRIFSPERTGFDADGTAHLGLRPGMDDDDAHAVARFGLVPERRAEVSYIYESMLLNEDHGEGYVPVVLPPFRGATTMVLHGKRIKSGKRWHYLVFRIQDCTGPYPYERLRFVRDNDGRGDGTKDRNRPEAYKDDKKTARHTSQKAEEPEVSSDDEPSLDRFETLVRLTGGRFSSTPEDIEKLDKDECRFRAAENTANVDDGETTGLSTADGDHGKTELDRLRISREWRAGEDLSDRLATFLDVLEEMRRQETPHLHYRLVTVPSPTPDAEDSGISFFPDRFRGRTLAWSFIPGTPRARRRIIVAEVQYQCHHFYLFEAEKRPSVGENEESIASLIVHGLDGASLSPGLLAQILLQGAKNGGVWLRDWQWQELRREKLVHQSVTVQRFAERFVEYFREVIPVAEEVPLPTPPETPETSLPNVA